jgi:hypothetical protein
MIEGIHNDIEPNQMLACQEKVTMDSQGWHRVVGRVQVQV